MELVVATTTLNSADVLEAFLRHLFDLDAKAVLVMDLGSKDDTLDILNRAEWRGQIVHVPCPGLENLDPSNISLDEAKRRFRVGMCLFCDPDEFISPEIKSIGIPDDVSLISLPRVNMTTTKQRALEMNLELELNQLHLQIDRPVQRKPADWQQQRLDPPWIFSRIGKKVLVSLSATERIGPGDHSAQVAGGDSLELARLPMRHYPMRSLAAFEKKVEDIIEHFRLNPDLPPNWGAHWRRWARLHEQGLIRQEFLDQFVEGNQVEQLVADGTLSADASWRPTKD